MRHTNLITVPGRFTVGICLDNIGDYRADNYQEWIKIGSILYSIYEGGSTGLEHWDKFSKRSSKYCGLSNLQDIWSKFKICRYTLGSLVYMARQDSGSNVELQSRVQVSKDLFRFHGGKIPRNVTVFLISVKSGLARKFGSIIEAASFLGRCTSYIDSGRKDSKKILESKVDGLKYTVGI